MPGETAVAGPDEDSLTLAIDAALLTGIADDAVDAVYFASTTSPYREKQAAATIAAVLDCAPTTRTTDVTDSLRAGTSAMLAGLDALAAGSARRVLVCAGDCRMGEPGSPAEQSYGDAGAAVVLGRDAGIAEILSTSTIADEFHGTWRTEAQSFSRSFPGSFESKHGYARVMPIAIARALAEAGVSAAEVTTAVLAAPSARAAQGVAKGLGLDPRRQVTDVLWNVLGDTGAAQALLLLAGVLERAKPGDTVLVAAYGDGADAAVLRVTDAIVAYRPARSVFGQIERKKALSSYGVYARARQLVRQETGAADTSTPVSMFRDRRELLPLYGGRCPRCAVVQFPMHRICIECGHRGGLDATRLGRRGTVFTFTHDHLAEGPMVPSSHAVVDLEGGGRIYVQLTDCEPDAITIDLPVELTFRKYHEGFGMKNYFWKARPLRN
jgi:3-hydroxy-3-methylglutaryl CoA synthase